MTDSIILANSTGTLIQDIGKVSTDAVEERAAKLGVPGMFAALKSDDPDLVNRAFDAYVLACDPSIMESGEYDPQPVNGAEALPDVLEGRKIGIYAAALPDFLHEAYRRNGLDGVLSHILSICDHELNGGRASGVGRKTPEMYAKTGELLSQDGLTPVAYVSHKPKEAKIGAEVFGTGIFIGNQADVPDVASGEILVVPSIDSREFRDAVAYVHPV